MTYFKTPNALVSSKVLYFYEMFFSSWEIMGTEILKIALIYQIKEGIMVYKKGFFSSEMYSRNATCFFAIGS